MVSKSGRVKEKNQSLFQFYSGMQQAWSAAAKDLMEQAVSAWENDCDELADALKSLSRKFNIQAAEAQKDMDAWRNNK